MGGQVRNGQQRAAQGTQLPAAQPAAALPAAGPAPLPIASSVENNTPPSVDKKNNARSYEIFVRSAAEGLSLRLTSVDGDIHTYTLSRRSAGSTEGASPRDVSTVATTAGYTLERRNAVLAAHLEHELMHPSHEVTSRLHGVSPSPVSFNLSPRAWLEFDRTEPTPAVTITGCNTNGTFQCATYELSSEAGTVNTSVSVFGVGRDYVRERNEVIRAVLETSRGAPGRLRTIASEVEAIPDFAITPTSSPAVFSLLSRAAAQGVSLHLIRLDDDKPVFQLRKGEQKGKEITLTLAEHCDLGARDRVLSDGIRTSLIALAPEAFGSRDARREELVTKLLDVGKDVGAEFAATARYTLRLLPVETLAELADAGVTVKLKHHMSEGRTGPVPAARGQDSGITENHVGGIFRWDTKTVDLAEFVLRGDSWGPSPFREGTALHEIGHALDCIRGEAYGKKNNLTAVRENGMSAGQDFFKAHTSDWHNLPESYRSSRTDGSYYLQRSGSDYTNGRQESIATAYEILGDYPFGIKQALFLTRFPRVLEAAEKILGVPRELTVPSATAETAPGTRR